MAAFISLRLGPDVKVIFSRTAAQLFYPQAKKPLTKSSWKLFYYEKCLHGLIVWDRVPRQIRAG